MDKFDLTFDAEDLVLDDLAVTTMRDAVALPESGASVGVSCGSSCCCQPQLPNPTS